MHYFISAPGYRKLTTQFNIEGDKYLWDDFAFGTREGLVAEAADVTDEAEIARRGLKGPFKHIQFNVVLQKDLEGALLLKLNVAAQALNTLRSGI